MIIKATLAATVATFCTPAVCDELHSYTVTVLEQIRHQITVQAVEDYVARTDALLEVRRTSGSGKPRWTPSPPTMLVHTRQADGFAVIDIKSAPSAANPDHGKARIGLMERVAGR